MAARKRIVPIAIIAVMAVLLASIVAFQFRPSEDVGADNASTDPSAAATEQPGKKKKKNQQQPETDLAADGSVLPVATQRKSKLRPLDAKPTVTYRVKTKDPVYFITVDDGTYKDPKAAQYVLDNKLPVTSFIVAAAIGENTEFFEKISAYGSIQNHTATHQALSKPSTDLDHEICWTQQRFRKLFDATPWMLRPPYGYGPRDARVQAKSQSCGVKDIVMWDVSINKGRISYADGKMHKGSIMLLHFTPTFLQDLKFAVKMGEKKGLQPANLADYLPQP